MQVTEVAPSERLAPFVRHLKVVEAREETTCVLIPDGAVVVGFRYSGSATLLEGASATRMPDASFVGVRDTARRMRTSAGGGIVLAVFREGGAASFFADPLHELFGASLALDTLAARSEVESTAARVERARSQPERIAAVERFLLDRARRERPDPLVAAAVRAIKAAPGAVRIGALAAQLGLSHDRLEKLFRRAVGASPKELASILRLQRAIDAHRAGASLARASAEAGFFDQSHFHRAFRAAFGEAPQRFFGSTEAC